ncbi:MAG: GNAT family N-acetyltransferase [Candidatus Lokiarchaeota archaeon]|nr:GNAT family N-acetyltransferase [Candidatus Lokiarchaeota archaeon]
MEQRVPVVVREAVVADAEGIARVHVDTWRSAYAGLVPTGFLASLSYEEKAKKRAEALEKPWSGSKTFVADAGATGGIVAFAAGGHERSGHHVYKGELFAIYVSEKHQNQGIGFQLVIEVVKHLRTLGLNSMLTWALADNPYARFYEKLGGERVGEKWEETGGKVMQEIAFGWRDLSVF